MNVPARPARWRARGRTGRLAGALLLGFLSTFMAPRVRADDGRQVQLGLEELYYRTAEAPLNRGNLLGLARDESLLRGTLSWRETKGALRVVGKGFVERRRGGASETSWTAREAYVQYGFGEGLFVRAGKQRVAWGSGFAWNPTNRIEPPKNPLNTGLEQEGALALRLDFIPTPWAGVILLAARSAPSTGDLPFTTAGEKRRTAAVRARFLVRNTDLAVVYSGGTAQRTVVGLDAARSLGPVSLHAEVATYRGAELPPAREGQRFWRAVVGGLRTFGESTSVSLEYFLNEEGYRDAQRATYLGDLESAAALALSPLTPPGERPAALQAYGALAGLPYAGGLGLGRHYLQGALTRSSPGGRWTTAARGVLGLTDRGLALTPGLSFAPRGDVTTHLDAVLLFGSQESEYRLSPIRGAVQARVRVLF